MVAPGWGEVCAWLLPGGMRGCLGGCVVAPGGVCSCSGEGGGMHGCSRGGACVVAPGGVHGCSGGVHACTGGHVWLLLRC